jgi:hypothetical protein
MAHSHGHGMPGGERSADRRALTIALALTYVADRTHVGLNSPPLFAIRVVIRQRTQLLP